MNVLNLMGTWDWGTLLMSSILILRFCAHHAYALLLLSQTFPLESKYAGMRVAERSIDISI